MAVVEIVRQLNSDGDYLVVYCTGRPEERRKMTEAWMSKHDIPFHSQFLMMRKDDDHRPDYVVKEEMLDQIITNGHDILFVIDDRPEVVKMWRRRGLTCLAMDEGKFESMYLPETASKKLLYLMVGPSGAGKSTYITDRWSNHPGVLSSDALRQLLAGSVFEQSKNELVFAAIKDIATARLKYGMEVVIDATHLHRRDRLAHVALAPKDSIVTYVVVDRPLKDKIRDAGWRAGVSVKGKPLVQHHHDIFQQNLKDILNGDGIPNVVVQDSRSD